MRLSIFTFILSLLLILVVVAVSSSLVYVISSLDSASCIIHQTSESIFLSQELRHELIKFDLQDLEDTERAERIDLLRKLARKAEQYVTSEPERDTLATLQGELAQVLEQGQVHAPFDLAYARRLALSLVAVNREQAEQLRDQANRHYRLGAYIGVGASSLVILLSAALLFAVRRHLMTPLSQLRRAVDQFSEGRPLDRQSEPYIRELHYLRDSLNYMAETIRDSHRRQLEFVAGVAHDLRNPLNSMSLSLQLLARGEVNDRQEIASLCRQQVQHLNALLEDLLDQSRIEAGQLQLFLDRVDLNEIVQEVFQLHHSTSSLHTFVFQRCLDVLLVNCDRHRIIQVLHNLLTNAVKYSPGGGEVFVATERRAGRAVIIVRDAGLGIRQDELMRIFEPFRRGSRTSRIRGVGLGLSVAKKLIEQHSGRIAASSEIGRGSQFIVELPICEEDSGVNPQSDGDAATTDSSS